MARLVRMLHCVCSVRLRVRVVRWKSVSEKVPRIAAMPRCKSSRWHRLSLWLAPCLMTISPHFRFQRTFNSRHQEGAAPWRHCSCALLGGFKPYFWATCDDSGGNPCSADTESASLASATTLSVSVKAAYKARPTPIAAAMSWCCKGNPSSTDDQRHHFDRLVDRKVFHDFLHSGRSFRH